MLQALELVGFKSFAEKTRFEFSAGITAVVGPNGSGKSNVVDAIKWALGEQSIKSLRGKEMTDVIFNGSSSRKPAQMAEVTLTFDNSRQILPLETPEVHITRRVYRSGESEYLINRQPSRLKDIRELLLGTGTGTDAYSVIEQGKVDGLLQASSKDRREIFEEAAGISRFKAKKNECLKRLERVDQNLLRLADIVEEVENQLRNVRNQASKAHKYREQSTRLQTLRTQLGWSDWHRYHGSLNNLEGELEARRTEVTQAATKAELLESEVRQLETQLDHVNEALQGCQRQLAENRERLAAGESSIDYERARAHELERETARLRRQLAGLQSRSGELRQQLNEAQAAEASAEEMFSEAVQRLAAGEQAAAEIAAETSAAEAHLSQAQAALKDALRKGSTLHKDIVALESQAESSRDVRRRAETRLSELDAVGQELETRLTQLRKEERDRDKELEREQRKLHDLQTRVAERRAERGRLSEELSRTRSTRQATLDRSALLEEMEQRREGVSPGVKQVLDFAQEEPRGPYGQVQGMVADLFQVSMEIAPLIEIALGEAAQGLVVTRGKPLLDFLVQESPSLPGRVSFVRLDVLDPHFDGGRDLTGEHGVIGRADRFVQTSRKYQPLLARLLGKTWIVETLEDALALSAYEGLDFVTLSGEALWSDGTLSLGPRHSSMGLLSRRSELRDLAKLSEELAEKVLAHEAALAELDDRLADDDTEVRAQSSRQGTTGQALQALKQSMSAIEGRFGQLSEQRANLESELETAARQHDQAIAALANVQAQRTAADAAFHTAEANILAAQEQINQLQARRERCATEVTTAKIAVAKCEERLEGLRTRLRQFHTEQDERRKALHETQEQLHDGQLRAEVSFWNILRAESELAEAYLLKEQLADRVHQLLEQRDSLSLERGDLSKQALALRARVRQLDESLHARDLEVNENRHRLQVLVERLREEYDLDLAALAQAGEPPVIEDRAAVEREIEDLRKKLSSLGHVNLDALAELDDLELRFQHLSGQYQDLVQSKAALEQIIQRINQDSRRLFAETLEAIRKHFQELFRKLFGGGQGDIVVDGNVDILDSGIEIVARPPGKELRSISLLSGGEKTLTCVALLLSIFRNRPSPFCVLDEVDAALDEANVERFVNVVKEFLTMTQFIIISHSKKTMTCANALYGVTMQESGVSKRVSVRFEDVHDNGDFNLPRSDEQAA